jgi:WYL_2, Sm-like SH3 beta-barrel fold
MNKFIRAAKLREQRKKMMQKFELVQKLENGVITVVFEKVNGEERTMQCTLLNEYLPKNELLSETTPRVQGDNLVSVWDIENNGWRSIRVDSLKQVL